MKERKPGVPITILIGVGIGVAILVCAFNILWVAIQALIQGTR